MLVLNKALEWLSDNYLGGLPIDRIATVVSVLLSYVLAHLFRRIPSTNPTARHFFSIVSTVLLFGLVQEQYLGLMHLTVGSLVIYALMRLLKGSLMPKVVFLVAMLHMSYSQLRRQWVEQASEDKQVSFDYTGAQMIFVIKVTSLAFCIFDGQKAKEDAASLSAYQRKNAIAADNTPSLLEYLGYVFFFPGFAVGPSFEMSTYRRMISFDSSAHRRQLNTNAYTTLLVGLFWMVVYIVYNPTFSFLHLATTEFQHKGVIAKAVYLCTTGIVARAAYYTAWKMSEGACVLAGLGFDGFDESDGSARWMDISNVHIGSVELGTSIRELIDGWNIGTNTWLRHHVYLRIMSSTQSAKHVSQSSSAAATAMTFMVSAWWHGFYPGYYLTFVIAAFVSSAARTLRRNLNPLVAQTKSDNVKLVYNFAGWVLSKYTLDFTVSPFMVLTLPLSVTAWRNNYFSVPIAVVVIHLAFNVLGAGHYLRRHLVGKQASTKI
ncbi:Lysophospholipid acyltransferase [Coemansia sp. IMI 209128]|nr:Lysophospholipid acyltransferase [Coemansia sp. S85]KAJ2414896.1 Lysophospholipid acyltransferase [Coemansia sp. RSA 2530]KAJ2701068.1 Lysophospholipid acyltransferase [Coemansia sp. IMI 209128]